MKQHQLMHQMNEREVKNYQAEVLRIGEFWALYSSLLKSLLV